MRELRPGEEFAGLRVDSVLGRGGMGVVYRAVQLALDRTVALKVIAAQLAADPGFRHRFQEESRAAASIDHPNALPIHHAGEQDGVLYLVMRLVEGSDLRAAIRHGGPLQPERAARIVAAVAGALDAAHAAGLVHRDVKPANILLAEADHPYLTDFGLTKRSAVEDTVTRGEGWVGTLGYVAPEQIRGGRVDARTDVYALGCVLHATLTGRPPYERDTDEATMWAHLHEPPPPLPGDVPAAFGAVIERALAKDPDDRYHSAGDLGRAALAAAGLAPTAAQERTVAAGAAAPLAVEATSVTAKLPKRRTRGGPSIALAGMVAAVLVAAAIAVALAAGGDEDDGGGRGGGAAGTRGARVVATIPGVGDRPNGIAITRDRVWVASFASDTLTAIDRDTNERVPRNPVIGTGATDIAAGFGYLWVVKASTNRVLRIDADTGRIAGPPIDLPPGRPVSIVTGDDSVWVGSRPARGQPSHLVTQLDPRQRRVLASIPVPRGVQDIAVGFGRLWITNRRGNSIAVIPVDDTTRQSHISAPRGPNGIAVGAGHVWVVGTDAASVARIDPDSRQQVRIPVGPDSRRIAVGDGVVWVSDYTGSQLIRIEGTRQVGTPLRLGVNPFKLVVAGDSVWVTIVGENAVQRVVF